MEKIKLEKPFHHRIPFLGGSITRTLLIKSAKAKEIHGEKSPTVDYKTYLETIEGVKFKDLSSNQKGVLFIWVGILFVAGILLLSLVMLIVFLALMVIFQPILPPQIMERVHGLEEMFDLLPPFMQIFTVEDMVSTIEEDIYPTPFLTDIITGWQMILLLILVFIFLGFCFAFVSIPFKIIYANLMSVCLTSEEKIMLEWLKDPNLPQEFNPKVENDFRGTFYPFEYYHPGMNVEKYYVAIVDTHYFLVIFFSILSIFFVWTAFGLFLSDKAGYGFTNLVLAITFGAVVILLLERVFGPYLSLKRQASFYIKNRIIEATNEIHICHSAGEEDLSCMAIRLKLLYFQSLQKDVDQSPIIPVSRYIKIYGYITLLIPVVTIFI
ncbi:MAG: hypothetical protein ACFE9L_07940 [Candidatus Hodarchaeota archaeon]